jgi:hypothetical protein
MDGLAKRKDGRSLQDRIESLKLHCQDLEQKINVTETGKAANILKK